MPVGILARMAAGEIVSSRGKRAETFQPRKPARKVCQVGAVAREETLSNKHFEWVCRLGSLPNARCDDCRAGSFAHAITGKHPTRVLCRTTDSADVTFPAYRYFASPTFSVDFAMESDILGAGELFWPPPRCAAFERFTTRRVKHGIWQAFTDVCGALYGGGAGFLWRLLAAGLGV
jgi:hypothetical protein